MLGGLRMVGEAHEPQLAELYTQPGFDTQDGSREEQDWLGDLQREKKMGLCSAE